MTVPSYIAETLPQGVRSRMIHGINGLDVHILEGGHAAPDRPLIVLLHGFPDLAYGWRRLIPILAASGYYVVAPDLRGYGGTIGWHNAYDTQLEPFSLLNMVRDTLGLVSALGYRRTVTIVGHDIGSPVASYCALVRPDVFPSLVLMSAPFPGPPTFPFHTEDNVAPAPPSDDQLGQLSAALAALVPPRQHYQQYLSSQQANADLWHPPQGLHAFLRAFFHVKSADWAENKPHPLNGRTAADLAQMPTYYVMELGKTMPATVLPFQPSAAEIQACKWLTERELCVYTEAFGRTGFQGALQAYRVFSDPNLNAELRLFSGQTINVPSLFIGGTCDWGTYAAPGALDLLRTKAMTRLEGIEFIELAGHWIQQEQPVRLGQLLLDFVNEVATVRTY